MQIIDSHFHWWPREIFEDLCGRTGYPRAERNSSGGYRYWRKPGGEPGFDEGGEWHDLERQLERMDKLSRPVGVVSSIGPWSIHFSDLPIEEGCTAANNWNEHMAAAQKRYAGRFWGTAAVPLRDTAVALDVLNRAIVHRHLVGVNMPCTVGDDPRIDAERLEPFYARVEELGVPLLLHPTDAAFSGALEGYGGALHLTLGRVFELSAAAARLVFSGLLDRYPRLKIVLSHTGGALPYQSGRMDKNGGVAGLPQPISTYLKRMYTDTVSPHSAGLKFAIEYYGADHVLYGSDYPCWDPDRALEVLKSAGLGEAEITKIFRTNSEKFFGLTEPSAR